METFFLLLTVFSPLLAQENLLRNGSFEGTKKYWLDGGTLDEANPAHGLYSLRIDERPARSASIRIEPGQTVTVSVFARSDKPGKVNIVLCPSNRGVAQGTQSVWTPNPRFGRSSDIGPEWHRVSWTLQIPELDEGGKFLGSGDWWWNKTSWILWLNGTSNPIWVDGVCVTVGQDSSDYAPWKDIEVAAVATDLPSYAKNANLLEADSTVNILAAAFNPSKEPKKVSLRWSLLDYEGRRLFGDRIDREVTIEGGKTVLQEARVKLTGKGLMLARVSVHDREGKPIDKSDQPLTVLAFPKSGTAPNPDERFGGSLRGGPLVKAAQSIGLGWTRWYPHINWAEVQPEGQEDWKWPDSIVEELHQHGISVNAVLYSIPKWAKGNHSHLPKDMQEWDKDDPRWRDLSVETNWDRFVTAAVKHYANRSVVWEFANEPDIGKWDGGIYFNLLSRTYLLVKKANPEGKVLVDVTWPGVSGFTMGLMERGGGKHFDVHTFHNYATGPLANQDSLRELQTVFKSFGSPGKQIWFNEGWTYLPTSEDYAAPPIIDVSPPQAAQMIARTAADLFAAGLHKLVTFHIGYAQNGKSWWDWVGSGTEWWDDHGYPTVAVATYNVLADQLGLSDFVESISPEGIILHVFQDNRNRRGVAVAWSTGEERTLAIPLKNLARIEVMGNEESLPADGGKSALHLPGDQRPFYVFSKDGLSGKQLAEALRPLDKREAERQAEIASGARTFRLPEKWTGSEIGRTHGSILREDGHPRWRLGRVWPPDPMKSENFRPMPWNGRQWHDPENQLGGQPALTITPREAQFGARGAWGGGHGQMLPFLSFYAPTDGQFRIRAEVNAEIWLGGGDIHLTVLKIAGDKRVEKQRVLSLQNGKKVSVEDLVVDLRTGEEIVFVPSFPHMNVAATIRLADLRLVHSGPAAELSLAEAGLIIDAGSMGKFTLSYPGLIARQDQNLLKPIDKVLNGKQAVLKYAGGGELKLAIQDRETVVLDCQQLPAEIRKLRMDLQIGFSYADGGTWQIGAGDPMSFPKEKPAKPFLFQGNADTFRLTHLDGKSLIFKIPPYSYQQLQDNREWNWKVFAWFFIAPRVENVSRYTLKIAGSAGSGGARLVVDRFGQDAHQEFSGKVTREAELKEDVTREEAYYASLSPLEFDPYGGHPGSGAKLSLRRTGFFHVEQHGQRWLLVDPEGNAVFHLGLCSFQPGEDYTCFKGRENLYEWLPSYESEFTTAFHPDPYWSRQSFSFYLANVIRKYGKPYDREEWAERMIARVRLLGFNAIGAFSSPTQAQRKAGFPYVLSLPLGNWSLGRALPGVRGLFDPFDPETRAKVEALFAKSLVARAEDPLLIGYFLENEQAFEDLPRALPALKGSQPAKARLVEGLEKKYVAPAAFTKAWGVATESFETLRDRGLEVTTAEAAADVQAFTGLFLEEYYRLVADTFHKYDRNHLLLGNRWQPGTANSEQLCGISGRNVDVISVNYYAYSTDAEFLDRVHRWSGGKPMLLSEFYWASPSDTGLPGGKEILGQRARGLAYRNYVEHAAALSYVVGIEWFTLLDQARTGRFFERYNGENGNTGLFSVTDRPYRDFLEEARKTNTTIYEVLFGGRPPFKYDDPKFTPAGSTQLTVNIPPAEQAIKLDGQASDWPAVPPERISGKRLVEGAESAGLEATFRLSWDPTWLYLLVEVTDSTPMKNNHGGGKIWAGDAVELFLGHEKLDQPGALLFTDRQVLLSAGTVEGKPQWHLVNAPRQYECNLVVVPQVGGRGYTLEAAIPFEALSLKPVEGQRLRFDLAIDDSATGNGRARQLMWNGVARNSGDRTHWGYAVLAK